MYFGLTEVIVQPVDFTTLKSQATLFFVEFFRQVLFGTQLANPTIAPEKAAGGDVDAVAVEEVFVKAARIPSIATGIVFFLSKHVAPQAAQDKNVGGEFVKRTCEVAIDALKTGLDVMPGL
jgi:nucleolar MIF4G domain-containing protein 1